MAYSKRCCLALLAIIFAVYVNTAYAQPTEQKTTPSDVFLYTISIDQKLDKIGLAMGEDLSHEEKFNVHNIAPRDVYFQALTFYKKTSRLMYEFTRNQAVDIKNIKASPGSQDVLILLQNAEQHLSQVMQALNITDTENNKIRISKSNPPKNPKDVFLQINKINQKINQLLEFRFSSADVFENITSSIYRASAILKRIPGIVTTKDPNERKKNIKPSDVFFRLHKIHSELGKLLSVIDEKSSMLKLAPRKDAKIQASDTYDIASLVLSRLLHIASLVGADVALAPVYYPGKMVPSDAYQRASVLEKQVQVILDNKAKFKKIRSTL